MPGEFSAQIGKDFVNRVSYFFQDNFGFSVAYTAYEGPAGASIVVNGDRIRFDLIMNQKRADPQNRNSAYKVHFFCECKFRSDPKGLKTELKKFLKKALNVSPELRTQCSDNFRFLFICNQHFNVSQSNLESIEYIKKLLKEECSEDELKSLARRARILVLEDWFLGTLYKGRERI